MWPTAAFIVFVGFCVYSGTTYGYITQPNCTAKNKIACFVCFGESLVDCETEETVCCSGACFKLIDKDHQIILKGCTPDQEEDGSMKIRSYDVRVKNDEMVKGQSYFCTNGDYCNTAVVPKTSYFAFFACLLPIFIGHIRLIYH